jgi:hypothetical protein
MKEMLHSSNSLTILFVHILFSQNISFNILFNYHTIVDITKRNNMNALNFLPV